MKQLSLHARHSTLSLVLIAAFAAPNAYAATLTVDPTAIDEAVETDAKCSLREAVLSVNAVANQGGCVADVTQAYGTNDTIVLPAGTYNLTLTGLDESWTFVDPDYIVVNTPDATMGDLDIMQSVNIIGAGVDSAIIQWDPLVDEAVRDRIFHVYTTATATVNVAIQGVTITGGRTFEDYIADGLSLIHISEPTRPY